MAKFVLKREVCVFLWTKNLNRKTCAYQVATYVMREPIDLSTNLNITYLHTGCLQYLEQINLQNGNNINMTDIEVTVENTSTLPICLKVDDASAAANNNTPYNSWFIFGFTPNYYDSGNCTLGVDSVKKSRGRFISQSSAR
ncbi:MAG: hypothetical protein ABR595_01755 [Psychroflexus sp.]